MSDNSLNEAVETQVETVEVETPEVEPVETENEAEAEEEAQVESDVEDAPSEPEEPKESEDAYRHRRGMQKRIDKIRKREAEKDNKLIELQKELEQLKQSNPVNDEPKPEDFESYDEYENAKIEHQANKLVEAKEAERNQAEQQRIQQQMQQERETKFVANANEYKVDVPDYEEATQSFSETAMELEAIKGKGHPTLLAVSDAIFDSETPAHIIYQLGKNPDLAEQMADMTPMQAMKEVWKLEQSYKKPQKQTTKLPEPIKPVKNTAKPSKQLKDMDGAALRKRFNI